MQGSKSLLSRLVLRISVVTILSIAILSVIVYAQIDRTLEQLHSQTLQEQERSIASHLKSSRGINRVFLDMPASLRQFYVRMGDTYQYVIRDMEGNILFNSPTAFADYFPKTLAGINDREFQFTGPSGRVFSGLMQQENIAGQPVYVQVAQTQGASDIFSDEITAVFWNRLLWIGLPFYCVLLIVIILTLKEGLKPLHQAARDVEGSGIPDLNLRIDEKNVPTEALPFVRAINASFARLAKSITEQQELTENIAHELRTPLTILKAGIEMLEKNDRTAKLARDTDAMIKLVNQMLDATRLEYADMLEKKKVDLADVLSQACRDFFPLFIRQHRDLQVSGIEHPVYIKGNKDLIYRAICNLLDNALEYSPPGTPVEASLEGLTIRVKDHGKKIPESRREAIFKRFQKDVSPSASKSGVGIGLSIVSKTMEIHGGHADLEHTQENGNSFRMIFAK